jgi:hypothetical protein
MIFENHNLTKPNRSTLAIVQRRADLVLLPIQAVQRNVADTILLQKSAAPRMS